MVPGMDLSMETVMMQDPTLANRARKCASAVALIQRQDGGQSTIHRSEDLPMATMAPSDQRHKSLWSKGSFSVTNVARWREPRDRTHQRRRRQRRFDALRMRNRYVLPSTWIPVICLRTQEVFEVRQPDQTTETCELRVPLGRSHHCLMCRRWDIMAVRLHLVLTACKRHRFPKHMDHLAFEEGHHHHHLLTTIPPDLPQESARTATGVTGLEASTALRLEP